MTPEEILHLVTEIICALTRGAVAVADIISAYKQKRRRRREARAAASTLKDGQLRSQMMMSHPHQNLLQPQRAMTPMIMMMMMMRRKMRTWWTIVPHAETTRAIVLLTITVRSAWNTSGALDTHRPGIPDIRSQRMRLATAQHRYPPPPRPAGPIRKPFLLYLSLVSSTRKFTCRIIDFSMLTTA